MLKCASLFEAGGGTLCVLLALFCTSAANALKQNKKEVETNKTTLDWLRIWSLSLKYGIEAVQECGRVRPGQRSIIDPLDALNVFLSQKINNSSSSTSIELEKLLKELVDVAYTASVATAKMRPQVGRASYVDPSLISKPDAGATAISYIISSVYKSFIMYENQNSS